jgi:hypothetical protein
MPSIGSEVSDMREDDGTLAAWIERRKLEAEYGVPKQRLTLRIDGASAEQLRHVAEELDLSKTACAEELLERAITEAFEHLELFIKLSDEQREQCGYRLTESAAAAPKSEAA